jgi:hypothetical protein
MAYPSTQGEEHDFIQPVRILLSIVLRSTGDRGDGRYIPLRKGL